MAREKVDDVFWALRKSHRQSKEHSGVTKDRVRTVLEMLGHGTADFVDAVFALLDDTLESQFTRLASTHTFSQGATVAQLGSHVGILQRGDGKLDREGRDYWIKPLRELGAIEAISLPKGAADFVHGHIPPKSPTSAYRLSRDFLSVLRSPEGELKARLRKWAAEDAKRARLETQDRLAKQSREEFSNEHAALISAVQSDYAPTFVPGFECLYVDAEDGDRISEEEKALLLKAGIVLNLGDPSPDVLLFEPRARKVWCVEAVTSDGEVDEHKVVGLLELCKRSGCELAGVTTAYSSRKDWLRRQGKHQNIALGTYIWTMDDPGVQYRMLPPPK